MKNWVSLSLPPMVLGKGGKLPTDEAPALGTLAVEVSGVSHTLISLTKWHETAVSSLNSLNMVSGQ